MMNKHQVFVYGTLKQGNRIRGMDAMPGADLVGEAVTVDARYTLHDLGAFPGVFLDGHNRVRGEVWQVTDEVFDILDQIEGYPVFYNRVKVDTTQGTAWIYYLPDPEEYAGTPVPGTDQPQSTVEWNPTDTQHWYPDAPD